jgi:hypothetical protein
LRLRATVLCGLFAAGACSLGTGAKKYFKKVQKKVATRAEK